MANEAFLYRKTLRAAGAGLLCLVAIAAEAKDPQSILLVIPPNAEVWRVSTAGDLELVLMAGNEAGSADVLRGTTSPVPSPDQRLVAYTRAGDMWLFDVASKRERRLTHVGMRATETLASIDVFITRWSFDGRKILYAVSPGETEDPEGQQPPKRERSAKYGRYVLDLANGQNVAVKLPNATPLTWLPDESLLFESEGRLLAWRAPADSRAFAESVSGATMQVDVSRDGRKLAIVVSPSSPKWSSSQLLVIDLAGEPKKGLPITPLGRWAEYQWPKFSPSGERTAYIHQVGREQIGNSKAFRAISELAIDGKSQFRFNGFGRPTWIDESTVALTYSPPSGDRKGVELVVWNVDAAREVARHQIYRGIATRVPSTSEKANP